MIHIEMNLLMEDITAKFNLKDTNDCKFVSQKAAIQEV